MAQMVAGLCVAVSQHVIDRISRDSMAKLPGYLAQACSNFQHAQATVGRQTPGQCLKYLLNSQAAATVGNGIVEQGFELMAASHVCSQCRRSQIPGQHRQQGVAHASDQDQFGHGFRVFRQQGPPDFFSRRQIAVGQSPSFFAPRQIGLLKQQVAYPGQYAAVLVIDDHGFV